MPKQEVTCIGKSARVFYLFVNFIVWIFGLILIAIGGFVLENLHVYAFVYSTNASQLTIDCWVLVGLGCLVFLVGFNGVWACVRESVLWMKVYFVFMLVIIIGGLVTGILTLVTRSEARATVKANILALIKNEYGKGGIVDEGYDNIHQIEGCCGEEGPADWKDSYFSTLPENADLAVPESCCISMMKIGCNSGDAGVPANPALVYSKGCGNAIADFQTDNMTLLGMISLIMVALETISLILVCCVISTRPIPERSEKAESIVEEEDKL